MIIMFAFGTIFETSQISSFSATESKSLRNLNRCDLKEMSNYFQYSGNIP